VVAGKRRAGKPRSESERQSRHKKLHGGKAPKRGTGLRNRGK